MPERYFAVDVFLADRSITVRESVAAILAARGLNIVGEAATPQDAMCGIQLTNPDVVLLNTQLEGGNGLQVLRAVRRTKPGIAFIVFSIDADPALRMRYLSAGANCFFDKASEFRQLLDAVAERCPPPKRTRSLWDGNAQLGRSFTGCPPIDPRFAQPLSDWQAAANRIGAEAGRLLKL